jgi:ferric-dicitrate binding protein FerR (iron transport regulator)
LPQDGFERLWNRIKPVQASKMINLWYRYAAVFIIALSIGILMRNQYSSNPEVPLTTQRIKYTSEKGSVSTIHLEDGSAIWLSSGSNIIILKSSNGEMSAQLDGEAYFDMIPDPDRKFSVDLGYFKIKDIGTKFNFRAFSSEAGIYASLVEGQIDLFNKGELSMLSMKPGEYMKFEKQTSNITVVKQDPSIATAWIDGKFVFIDKTLADICSELENWYNVEIIIGNKSLSATRYTSVIKRTTTVNMVMKMLSLTDKINYKITDRKEARDIVYIY